MFTLSPIHDDALLCRAGPQDWRRARDIDALYIKDPGGLLSPKRASTLIPAIKAQIGAKPLELHAHCTIGLAELLYMDAPELRRRVPCSARRAPPPMASRIRPPNGSVANLRALGTFRPHRHRGAGARWAATLRVWPRPKACRRAARRASMRAYLRHQLPGGMVGTMRRHLGEIRAAHLEGAVTEELGRVREELGWPIVMTPFSQILLTQAVMNVTGRERYAVIPDELIRYALGRFGKPTVPIDPQVMDRIESLPRAAELRAEPAMAPLAELRRRLGPQLERRGIPAARDDARGAGRCHAGRGARGAALRSVGKAGDGTDPHSHGASRSLAGLAGEGRIQARAAATARGNGAEMSAAVELESTPPALPCIRGADVRR